MRHMKFVVILALLLAPSLFAQDVGTFAPVANDLAVSKDVSVARVTPDTVAETRLLAADFPGAWAEYMRLLKAAPDGPLADYYFSKCLWVSRLSEGVIQEDNLLELKSLPHKTPALVSALGWLEMRRLKKKADLPAAATLRTSMGFVTKWLYIGPFDNSNKSGHKTVYAPEKGFALDEEVDGKNGPNVWRPLPAEPPFGEIRLGGLFREKEYVTGYLLTFVESSTECEAALNVSSTGPFKVWVNDQPVGGFDAYRSFGCDQNAVGAVFRKGWNKVLVKLSHVQGEWLFAMRATLSAGPPASGLSFVNSPQDISSKVLPAYVPAKFPVVPDAYEGSLGYLKKTVEETPTDDFATAAFAFLKWHRLVHDDNDLALSNLMRNALKRNPGNRFYRFFTGLVDDDRNLRVENLSSMPDSPLALFALAMLYSSTDREWRFIPRYEGGRGEYSSSGNVSTSEGEEVKKKFTVSVPFKKTEAIDAALAIAPEFVSAAFEKALTPPERGDKLAAEESRQAVKAMGYKLPNSILAQSLAFAYSNASTTAEFEAHFRKILALDQSWQTGRRSLIEYLRNGDKRGEAMSQYAVWSAMEPLDPTPRLELAGYYKSLDDYDKALEAYDSALKISPEDVSIYNSRAECLIVTGDVAGAEEVWKKALEIKPNLPEVTKHLEFLKPEQKRFWEGMEEDIAAVAKAALADPSAPEDASVICFLENKIIKVNQNGTHSFFVQKVIKAMNDKGAAESKYIDAGRVNFELSANISFRIISAKLYKKDGSVLESDNWEESSYCNFDSLEAGDVVALEVQGDESGQPRYKGYYGGLVPLRTDYTLVKKSILTLAYPKDKAIYFAQEKFDAVPEVFEKDGIVLRKWEVSDLPMIIPEYGMPPFLETVPYLHVSTFKDWNEMASWVTDLVSEQFQTGPEIKKFVAEKTAGITSTEEKVDALYKALVTEIRYEAVELSAHAYKPFEAYKVFEKRYGDCKDTASLFVTMLKEAGIEGNFVVVRTNDLGGINTEIPSMKIFNHAISYVPATGRFYDLTARYCGSKEIPQMDEGALMVVLDGKGGGRIVYPTPRSAADDNLYKLDLDAVVAKDGSMMSELTLSVKGCMASSFRQPFQPGADREKLLERFLNNYFGTSKIDSLEISDVTDYNSPVLLKVKFGSSGFIRKDGLKMTFDPFMFAKKLSDNYASLEERKFDMDFTETEFGFLQRAVFNAKFTLPDGYGFVTVPESASFKSTFGEFVVDTKKSGPTFTLTTEFVTRLVRLPVGEYPEFRTFCAEVDRLEKEEVSAEPVK